MSQLSVVLESPRTGTLRVLVISESPVRPGVVQKLVAERGIDVVPTTSLRAAREPDLLARVDAVMLCESPGESVLAATHRGEIQLLADALLSHRLKCVVLSSGTTGGVPCEDDAFVSVSAEISTGELYGRLAMIKLYAPHLRRMEAQVSTMQRLGKRLNRQFAEVDQELRLATRLQGDFLPKELPEVNDFRFAALFRPANWVSGDVYDVRRLDESHTAFYLADAVGHGVAAGLLTMFIRQSIVGKHVNEANYEIIPPGAVLTRLNNELAQQQLPNSQFVTACYALIHSDTHEITFARGGHPHPIHVNAAGVCNEVHVDGGLLGVFPDEVFPATSLVLEPGEKFILYSDGLENDIFASRDMAGGDVRFSPRFVDLACLSAGEFLAALSGRLDQAEGSLAPADDMTCIVVERQL